MHQDITWRNVLRNMSGTNWIVIVFDEATATPSHAHELREDTHALEMISGPHDSSVNI